MTTTAEYTIDCTGDCVVGDEVRFERAIFSGSYRRPNFIGTEIVEGVIIKDSYGAGKQQHTFTLELADGTKTLIKGRNLYRNGVYRKPWFDEAERKLVANEKHLRGNSARQIRAVRRENQFRMW